MQHPVTVLHLLSSAAVGGAAAQARIVATLASGLDPALYRVQAWFLEESGPLVSALAAAGVPARFVRFRGRIDPVGMLRFAGALASERPSLIHLHIGGRSRTWLCRRFSSAKLVAHLHGAYGEDGRPLSIEPLARAADAVIATCKSVAEEIPQQATIVYPGVPVRERTRETPKAPVPTVGTAARLEPIKRISDLLAVGVALRRRHPNLRIEIAGAGACEHRLRRLAREMDLAESVQFLGWKDDLSALHHRWSVFVAPSEHEGLPIAALEAMASGLPVVASAVDGLRELVDEGVTGYLVPVGDINAFIARIDRLLSDEPLRARMGEAGSERARRHFGTTQMIEGIAGVYDRLLSGRGDHGRLRRPA